jgi:hypothetical protein
MFRMDYRRSLNYPGIEKERPDGNCRHHVSSPGMH